MHRVPSAVVAPRRALRDMTSPRNLFGAHACHAHGATHERRTNARATRTTTGAFAGARDLFAEKQVLAGANAPGVSVAEDRVRSSYTHARRCGRRCQRREVQR